MPARRAPPAVSRHAPTRDRRCATSARVSARRAGWIGSRGPIRYRAADAVGRHHQVLDQRFRAIRASPSQILAHRGRRRPPSARRARSPGRRPCRAAPEAGWRADPEGAADARDRRPGERVRSRPGSVEPCSNGVVGEPRAIAHERAIDVGFDDASVRVNRHLCHDRGPVFAFVERRSIGRQLRRQHREDQRRCVDGRRVRGGVRVERRLPRHEAVDVRDGHEDGDTRSASAPQTSI